MLHEMSAFPKVPGGTISSQRTQKIFIVGAIQREMNISSQFCPCILTPVLRADRWKSFYSREILKDDKILQLHCQHKFFPCFERHGRREMKG